MDLNYLFYRQQVERSRAEAANTEEARKAHEELAIEYERQIGRAAEPGGLDGDDRPTFRWRVASTDLINDTAANATIAVAMTAREVGRRQR